MHLNGNDLIFGTGTTEYMDHGASSNIRLYTASTLRSTWDATGQTMASGYRLTMEDEIRFTGITKPGSNSQNKIYSENLTNDELVLNHVASGEIRFDEDGTNYAKFGIGETQIGSVSGYNFNFLRNDTTPTANDEIVNINFQGNNASSTTFNFARIVANQRTVTATGEDGELEFFVLRNGTLESRLQLSENAVTLDAPSGVQINNGPLDMSNQDINNAGDIDATAFNRNTRPSITGSRGGNVALASLLSAFDGELWDDNTT